MPFPLGISISSIARSLQFEHGFHADSPSEASPASSIPSSFSIWQA